MNKYVLTSLLSVAAILLSGCNNSNEPLYTVTKSDLSMLVSANGELESATTALLAPPAVDRMWQYQIKTMVPENSQVKKGDVVISFEDKPVRDRLIDKQAQLDRAQKELENAENRELIKQQELALQVAEMQMNYDKAKRRADIVDHSRSEVERKKSQIDFIIANNDLTLAKRKQQYQQDSKELNIKMAQSKVARLQSEVNGFKKDIARLKVKAPIDGLVIYRTNYSGEKSSIGESVQFGQPVLQLSVLENMQVQAQIDEPDSGKVKVGQTVKITIDGSTELVVSGKIKSLGRVFREKSFQDKRRIIDAIVSIDNVDTSVMRPGLTTRLEITTDTFEQVLSVPISALSYQQGEAFVTLANSQQAGVNISGITGSMAIIKSGLTAGEEVKL